MSYEDGYPLLNFKDYSISYISHALGYYPRDINKTLETTKSSNGWELPIPDNSENNVMISNYAKRKFKTKYNVKIYETNNINNIINLCNKLFVNKILYESVLEEEFSNSFSKVYDNSNGFIIKKIPCHNIRYMYAGFKEATMMHKIDVKASEQNIKLVPKVYFSCPLYSNDKWYYIIVMEKINGILLKTLTKPFNKFLRYIPYDKKKIIEATKTALGHLWSLGFSHNDLHDGNIMYDEATDTILFLDCETVILHTDEDVKKFNELKTHNCIVPSYIQAYKDSSVSLLYIASFYTISYADKDNLIYNTDDWLLSMLQDTI